MSFIINQNFDLKSPQFNFARDYYKDIATLRAESEDNFPDHFITNVAGTLYQITKSNSVDATTGKWRALKFGLTSGEIDAKGYATKTYVDTHINNKSNPHGVTKAQVGLGNVDNTSDANKPISTATQTALNKKADLDDNNVVKTEQLPDDVFEIFEFSNFTDNVTLVNSHTANDILSAVVYDTTHKKFIGGFTQKNQVLSKLTYCDDISYPTRDLNGLDVPTKNTPEKGKLYVNVNNNKVYRWDGEDLVEVSAGVTLGEFNNFKGNVTSIEVCDTVTIDAMFA